MMDDSIDELIEENQFAIICNKCKGGKVTVSFDAGFIHAFGGDTGWLEIECTNCGNVIELS
jgi:hypothetical protein